MSVIGRGKGRGFAEARDTLLRRPGEQLSPSSNDLINLIDRLNISTIIPNAKIDEIVESINESISNNSLKETFEILYKQAVENRNFGTKLATVCGNSEVYSIDSNQFRFFLMITMQKDYSEREELKKKGIIQFRNAISFLGHIYNNLKYSGPLQFLGVALLDYLEMLLETSEEEDVEIIMIQISINGRCIIEKYATQLDDFIMRVKMVLIDRNISARSRGMLLYVIDLANKNFVPLPKKLQEFYTNKLGSDYSIYIKGPDKHLTPNTKSKNSINYKYTPKNLNKPNSDDNSEANLMKINKQGKNVELGSCEKTSPNTVNDRISVPRAIRGAGAADGIKDKNAKKLPRGRKDKLTDEQMWSSKQNTNSKVWGHDDRFEKDYD